MAFLRSFNIFATLAISFTVHFALAVDPPLAPNDVGLQPADNWSPMGFCAFGENAACGPSNKKNFKAQPFMGYWVYCCPGYYCLPDESTVKNHYNGPDYHCWKSGTQRLIPKPPRPTRGPRPGRPRH
uniref:Secreted protein n=1 Tax=Cuerna arida TaxID=1464854 RepID=A0A1B6GCJ9_9HEMI